MAQQLVLQFEIEDEDEVDAVVSIEDKLTDRLGGAGSVEGHEVGENNVSLILMADDPLELWEAIEPIVEKLTAKGPELRAVAYRPMSSSEYTVIWPDDFEGEFEVG